MYRTLNKQISGVVSCFKRTKLFPHCVKESESSAQTKELSKVKDVMLKCRAMTSERPKAMYSTKNLEMDLQRLIKVRSH